MPTAGEDLQELIQAWASENADVRTISYLARKSGVDYNTASRAWSGKNPECQTALAILYVICSKAVALEYLRKHFPHAARFHEHELRTEVYSDSEALRPMLQDKMSFVLLCRAYGGQGHRQSIQKTFGEYGVAIAEELVSTGRLKWKNDKLSPISDEEFFTFEAKADVISASENIVKLSYGLNGFPVALIGSLNDDEHIKFKSIIREFCHATKELVYSSKGGENLVTLSIVYVNLSEGVKE